tara:strand:+ start:303 stop:458 length:156 start_codon:yes stop_codon:yes gene_type:complete
MQSNEASNNNGLQLPHSGKYEGICKTINYNIINADNFNAISASLRLSIARG